MLEAVRRSRDDGLDPADYHLQALDRLFTSIRFSYLPTPGRRRRLAALELLLSDAFLLLGEHELNGRVNPVEFGASITARYHHQDLTQDLHAVMDGAEPGPILRGLAPPGKEYAALRDALAHYRVLDAVGAMTGVPPGPSLRNGDSGRRVADLIVRLEAEGDLRHGEAPTVYFGPEVEAGVRRFQSRHGMNSDGIAGAATLALLDASAHMWIDQIRVNMERWRWLPQDMADTRVVVNIADFRATLYENGVPTLTEPVVVGQPYRQTPEFSDWIRYLVINPAWDVPPVVASEDLLPKVQADPGYLERHGYQVIQGWNSGERPVDPASIDWAQLTASTLPYRFRQLPGPGNALGRVKFMFPNRFGVYLHDTPAQGLFAAEQRTFSSGCIRVAHAMDLAETLLRLDGRADPRQLLQQALTSGETVRLDLDHPIPIYVVYLTAWVDESGVVQLRSDVYGRDSEVLQALNAPLPENPACCNVSASP